MLNSPTKCCRVHHFWEIITLHIQCFLCVWRFEPVKTNITKQTQPGINIQILIEACCRYQEICSVREVLNMWEQGDYTILVEIENIEFPKHPYILSWELVMVFNKSLMFPLVWWMIITQSPLLLKYILALQIIQTVFFSPHCELKACRFQCVRI